MTRNLQALVVGAVTFVVCVMLFADPAYAYACDDAVRFFLVALGIPCVAGVTAWAVARWVN